MIPLNNSLLAYFLFLVAYMYHACPQRPTFAPPTSNFRKINVTFAYQEIKSLPFLPFTHTTVLQKSYSDPESETESEPEAQPIDFIHECFEEIRRHYGPRPWAPTEQTANEPTTPNTQRDTTTRPAVGRRRGQLLLQSVPPITGSSTNQANTSARITPRRPTQQVQPYALPTPTGEQQPVYIVDPRTDIEMAEMGADRWFIHKLSLLQQRKQKKRQTNNYLSSIPYYTSVTKKNQTNVYSV